MSREITGILSLVFLLLISFQPFAQTPKKHMVIAQIILKSASGASILDKEAVITSENVAQYQPTPATVRKAKKLLKSDGFSVTEGGIGLSASTSVENFEKVFGVKVQETVVKGNTVYKTERPVELPDRWKDVIESVDLPDPVDYH